MTDKRYELKLNGTTAVASTGGAAPSRTRERPSVPPECDPDAAADAVLRLLSEEKFQSARRLAAEALARYPEHPRIRGIWSIFDVRGKARVGSGGPSPSRAAEFAWLRDPPDWAHGKWVALVGGQAVAAAESLEEVADLIQGRSFARTPLVHRVD